jgi:5-methylcytosine-specific restriction endonuclease McrA
MNPQPKQKPVRLTGTDRILFKHSLLADQGFKCHHCKTYMRNTLQNQLHHLKSRGAGGGDTKDNCVILCWKCHRLAHDGKIKIVKQTKLQRY